MLANEARFFDIAGRATMDHPTRHAHWVGIDRNLCVRVWGTTQAEAELAATEYLTERPDTGPREAWAFALFDPAS